MSAMNERIADHTRRIQQLGHDRVEAPTRAAGDDGGSAEQPQTGDEKPSKFMRGVAGKARRHSSSTTVHFQSGLGPARAHSQPPRTSPPATSSAAVVSGRAHSDRGVDVQRHSGEGL